MTLTFVKLIGIFIGIFLTALVAACETALTSLSPLSITKLRRSHPRKTPFFLFWEQQSDRVLAVLVLGSNFSVAGTGVLAASLALDLSGHSISGRVLWVLIPASVTIAVLIFGEILPKILARRHAERTALLLVRPAVWLTVLLDVLTSRMVGLSRFMIRVLGGGKKAASPFLTPAELKILLQTPEAVASEVSPASRQMLKNVLNFADLKAEKIMTPREKIFSVDLSAPRQIVIEAIRQSGFSRIPVTRGGLDQVVGIIYSKDILDAVYLEQLILLEDIVRPVRFEDPEVRVPELLRDFRQGHHHLAVVSKGGKTLGLVTIEDVVEEIVGDISDEFDNI